MDKNTIDSRYGDIRGRLRIDCASCSGLCCVALYCMKTDGFPADKAAGVPCRHLMGDHRCDIHRELAARNMRGCLAYDCFGAGQKVTQALSPGVDWRSSPHRADEIFQAFLAVARLHQMEWYLLEALALTAEQTLEAELDALIAQNERLTALPPGELMGRETEAYQADVNRLLRQVCADLPKAAPKSTAGKDHFGKRFHRATLDGADFSMALLIAADLEGCSLRGANLLGADMRDANIKNTDLSGCAFLTQMQLNSARGNANTKLPPHLTRPAAWGN